MSKLRMRLVAVLGLAGSLLGAGTAHAYCRTNACDETKGDSCYRDQNDCWRGGAELFWPTDCVSFAVQKAGSPANEIGAPDFEAVIRSAFNTWQNAVCEGDSRPSIQAESFGEVECDQVEYNLKAANANIYMFRDDVWLNEDDASQALALTTVWHDHKTGQIRDVDVEVNGTPGSHLTNGDVMDGADLLSIITHETGHFLGLDHSDMTGSVMFAYYNPGEDNLRELTEDDAAGICEIYPADRKPDSTSCSPRRGFASQCDPPAASSGGCSVTTIGGSAPNAFLLLLAPLAAWSLSRRRRR